MSAILYWALWAFAGVIVGGVLFFSALGWAVSTSNSDDYEDYP